MFASGSIAPVSSLGKFWQSHESQTNHLNTEISVNLKITTVLVPRSIRGRKTWTIDSSSQPPFVKRVLSPQITEFLIQWQIGYSLSDVWLLWHACSSTIAFLFFTLDSFNQGFTYPFSRELCSCFIWNCTRYTFAVPNLKQNTQDHLWKLLAVPDTHSPFPISNKIHKIISENYWLTRSGTRFKDGIRSSIWEFAEVHLTRQQIFGLQIQQKTGGVCCILGCFVGTARRWTYELREPVGMSTGRKKTTGSRKHGHEATYTRWTLNRKRRSRWISGQKLQWDWMS